MDRIRSGKMPTRFITEDLQGGRLPPILEKELPCVLVGHWPGFYFNGEKSGFDVLKTVKTRLDNYDPDCSKTLWMKNSEIGHYWMARELTDIEVLEHKPSHPVDKGDRGVTSSHPLDKDGRGVTSSHPVDKGGRGVTQQINLSTQFPTANFTLAINASRTLMFKSTSGTCAKYIHDATFREIHFSARASRRSSPSIWRSVTQILELVLIAFSKNVRQGFQILPTRGKICLRFTFLEGLPTSFLTASTAIYCPLARDYGIRIRPPLAITVEPVI